MSNTATEKVRLLLVEDHELARYGLSMAFSARKDVEVIGEAENGRQGVDMALRLKPDVILMDIGMPIMNGIEATQAVKAHHPDIKIIMLTSLSNQEEVFASLAAGADAYCMKEIKMDRLRQVMDMVLEGAVWLDPQIAKIVMQSLSGNADVQMNDKDSRKRYNTGLTTREKEVLKLIVNGKSNKEIAEELNVTGHTAKAHVANIIQKLAVDDRTQAAVKALKEGMI